MKKSEYCKKLKSEINIGIEPKFLMDSEKMIILQNINE